MALTNQFIGKRTLWGGNNICRKPLRIVRHNPLQSPRMSQRCALGHARFADQYRIRIIRAIRGECFLPKKQGTKTELVGDE
jgi:hypothetical protein